jgi:hypothetical protein
MVKGATANRELEVLKCMLDFAAKRRYFAENPAVEVKHFNELRERPTRRMLTLEEERRILDAAPVFLRVAIILLAQGERTARAFHCAWSQEILKAGETSGRTRVSDLQPASRLLYSSQ